MFYFARGALFIVLVFCVQCSEHITFYKSKYSIMQSSIHTTYIHCLLWIVRYIIHTYYIIQTVYYIIQTVYYIIQTVYYIIQTVYYIIQTVYYIIQTVYYIIQTVYYIIQTVYIFIQLITFEYVYSIKLYNIASYRLIMLFVCEISVILRHFIHTCELRCSTYCWGRGHWAAQF